MSFLPYGSGGTVGWITATGSSAVVHGAALLLIMGGYLDMLQEAPEAETRPDFTVTLERLDADTLAGLILQDGLAGAEGTEPPDSLEPVPGEDPEIPESLLPEAATGPDAETLDGVEPDAPPEPVEEPETTEATEAETVEAAEVTALTAEQAEAAQPLSPDILDGSPADALQPIVDDVLAATPAAATPPVEASPLIPDTDTVVARAAPSGGAEALNPITLDTAPAAALPAAEPPQTAAPVTSEREGVSALAALRPELGAPGATEQASRQPQPRSEQDLAIGDLVQRIRNALAESCLVALPRRDGPDNVGLAIVAAQEQAMSRFVSDVLTVDDADIRQTRTLIDPRQCPALTYLRQNTDYPITRLGLALDSADVPSGGRLTGTLRGTAGRYVTLLLVDNNGVVQDLQRFMSFSGNFARFDVPVTLAEAPRDTSQILMALSTSGPATALRDRAGQLAEDVFADLQGELANRAAIAFVTFDVR